MKARSEVLASPQTFKLQDFLTSFLSSQPHAWNCQGSWRQLCSTVWISPLSPLVHNPKVHLISVYVLYEASSKFACLHLATQQVCPLFPFPTAQLTCLNIPPAPALPKFCHPTALPCRLGDLLAASTTFPASVIFMPCLPLLSAVVAVLLPISTNDYDAPHEVLLSWNSLPYLKGNDSSCIRIFFPQIVFVSPA